MLDSVEKYIFKVNFQMDSELDNIIEDFLSLFSVLEQSEIVHETKGHRVKSQEIRSHLHLHIQEREIDFLRWNSVENIPPNFNISPLRR